MLPSATLCGVRRYILVYPQGCDVCNHLSLFLCVADYDKLLPGWSHFAQFTIAVVNKDPKKSKYSGERPVPSATVPRGDSVTMLCSLHQCCLLQCADLLHRRSAHGSIAARSCS